MKLETLHKEVHRILSEPEAYTYLLVSVGKSLSSPVPRSSRIAIVITSYTFRGKPSHSAYLKMAIAKLYQSSSSNVLAFNQ
ncbi:MAG: hypothetical protein F6K58_03270 [Symploca sp. SIO2E9]|nr:hypothetical protein [Symploca sp. SIO2E9]